LQRVIRVEGGATNSTASDPASAQTIVLIHGMWMTPLSWEHYRSQGHTVVAKAWPGLEAEHEELRRDPSPLRNISITDVVDHYEKIIRTVDRPPIIIGHSFGGLFAQPLADRGLGTAAVALGTAAPGSRGCRHRADRRRSPVAAPGC
jgi:pimeloyl-ACP methyl ester carboxylesterase